MQSFQALVATETADKRAFVLLVNRGGSGVWCWICSELDLNSMLIRDNTKATKDVIKMDNTSERAARFSWSIANKTSCI